MQFMTSATALFKEPSDGPENLTADELKFRDELRAWLKANAPKDWNEFREESMEKRFELSPALAAQTF